MRNNKIRQDKQIGPTHFDHSNHSDNLGDDYEVVFGDLDMGRSTQEDYEEPSPRNTEDFHGNYRQVPDSSKWDDLKRKLETAQDINTFSESGDLYSTDLDLNDYSNGGLQPRTHLEDDRVGSTLDALAKRSPISSIPRHGSQEPVEVQEEEPPAEHSEELDIIEQQPMSWFGAESEDNIAAHMEEGPAEEELEYEEAYHTYQEQSSNQILDEEGYSEELGEAEEDFYEEVPAEDTKKLRKEQKKREKQERKAKRKQKPEEEPELILPEKEAPVPARKRASKGMAFFGVVMFLFALVGVAASAFWGIGFAKEKLGSDIETSHFVGIIQPLVMLDPPVFEDSSKLDNNTILASALWDVIMNSDSEKYDNDDFYSYIPQTDVEVSVKKLFGERYVFEHETVQDIDFIFVYQEEEKQYQVPYNLHFISYTPSIEEVEENGELYTLKVGYIPVGTTWGINSEGLIIAPQPQKYMKYVLRRTSKDEYIIVSLQYFEEDEESGVSIGGSPESAIVSIGEESLEEGGSPEQENDEGGAGENESPTDAPEE